MKFTGELASDQLTIDFGSAVGQVTLRHNGVLPASTATSGRVVNLLWAAPKLLTINQQATTLKAGEVGLTLSLPWEIEADYLVRFLQAQLLDAVPAAALPAHVQQQLMDYWQVVGQLIAQLGYPAFKSAPTTTPKKRPGKAVHRWSKAVSTVDFLIDYEGATGTARWVNRNEMVLAPGAKMVATAPLNKDGSLGFSARFAQQLRQEHQAEFTDFVTTVPIHLKSVNEIGLFLYFAGTNSWQVLTDKNGRTIDDWTVIK